MEDFFDRFRSGLLPLVLLLDEDLLEPLPELLLRLQAEELDELESRRERRDRPLE